MTTSFKFISLLALATSIAAGCATSPEKISPQYVSTLEYENLNCDQLATELDRQDVALNLIWDQQKKARSNDKLGIVFLGLPVSVLSGTNKESNIAQLKGQRDAVYEVAVNKQCRFATSGTLNKI